jgi:hypothetical protein
MTAQGKKWYGKLVFTREGVEQYHEFETKAEAKAYVQGVRDAKSLTANEDYDPLDEYQACHDQIEPVEE